MTKRIYLNDEELKYLKSLLEAQDQPEFEEYQRALSSILRKVSR